jgi:putative PIG3 family NAD(P)H quinone oxidoreductase
MKAIIVQPDETAPRLEWAAVPDILFTDNEVLVEVAATAVNRADLLQARGLYPPPPGESDILGLEISGRIAAVGGKVSGWRIGDRVMALVAGGGYAEKAAVPSGLLMPLPESWTFEQGAAIPEVWLTAFVNLFLEGRLAEGETVLIHAGASGVGTAATQLAAVSGAKVLTTAGSEAKLEACRQYGAALAIHYEERDFAAEIAAFADGQRSGVDLVLDPVGGDYFERNLTVLNENGRLVNIGLMGGRKAELDLATVLGKSLRIIGSRLRPRPLAEKIEITTAFRDRFWPLLEAGRLVPVIDSVFPIHQAQAAHDHMRLNKNIGKIILSLQES